MTDIMKLADDYAEEYSAAMVPQLKPAVQEARAALQSAIEVLQGEIEGLKRQLDAGKDVWRQDQKFISKAVAERDALAARLDELAKQQPVAWLHFDKAEANYGRFPWMLMVNQDHSLIAAKTKRLELHAAPKALEPLTELQINGMCADANISHDIDLYDYTKVVRDTEAAHGITKGTP